MNGAGLEATVAEHRKILAGSIRADGTSSAGLVLVVERIAERLDSLYEDVYGNGELGIKLKVHDLQRSYKVMVYFAGLATVQLLAVAAYFVKAWFDGAGGAG